ncbi:MAG TPA: Hsp70 family protein, partial [Candidatus Atribacteria bacterium]|nr:Hsp70 family protein [Candidatus Atribacteria bacterium]
RPMARDNVSLGRFQLTGIPPAPRGVPQIEVKFDIDADGILHVSAKDLATNREQAITIKASSGLSKEDIDRMIREAELHAEEDRRKQEEVEVRNQADNLVYTVEKSLRESGDRLSPGVRAQVENALSALKEAMGKDDIADIRRKMDDLQNASHAMAQELYQQTAQSEASASSQAGGSSEATQDDDVVDADYRVVDDDDTK